MQILYRHVDHMIAADLFGRVDIIRAQNTSNNHGRAKRLGKLTGYRRLMFLERPEGMAYESGGQGLWSTVDDLLTFARLFLGAGAVDGVRVLKPETMALMTANRLSDAQRASARLLGTRVFAGHGFGLGVAVVLEPEKAASIICNGAIGTVGWPGAFGGWWQADPVEQSIMIFLAHNALDAARMANGVGLGVYSAIAEFHATGSG